jgi:hypothetical protein
MPKIFYTERDIEDLVKSGATSLLIRDGSMVLTELAYEKAVKLGLILVKEMAENAPSFHHPKDGPNHKPAAGAESFPQEERSRNVLRFSPAAAEQELRQAVVERAGLPTRAG